MIWEKSVKSIIWIDNFSLYMTSLGNISVSECSSTLIRIMNGEIMLRYYNENKTALRIEKIVAPQIYNAIFSTFIK